MIVGDGVAGEENTSCCSPCPSLVETNDACFSDRPDNLKCVLASKFHPKL